jgi:hypothetical protein
MGQKGMARTQSRLSVVYTTKGRRLMKSRWRMKQSQATNAALPSFAQD